MTVSHYSKEGPTAVITMDDGKANALSEAMLTELEAHLTRAEGEASAVVLTGRPERFCAGFDLKIMMSSPEAATALLRRGGDLLMRLYGSPLPIVVACTGHAVAGGALVLLTADVRIGAKGAFRIGLNEVAIGLTVPVLAVELARDRLATAEVYPATLGARMYEPGDAVRAGYLDEALESGEVLARAKSEAARLGALSNVAFRATKSRLRKHRIEHILASFDDDVRAITQGR